MLGVLLEALPKKSEERETINLITEKNLSRETSLPKATGDLMCVH